MPYPRGTVRNTSSKRAKSEPGLPRTLLCGGVAPQGASSPATKELTNELHRTVSMEILAAWRYWRQKRELTANASQRSSPSSPRWWGEGGGLQGQGVTQGELSPLSSSVPLRPPAHRGQALRKEREFYVFCACFPFQSILNTTVSLSTMWNLALHKPSVREIVCACYLGF